MSRVGRRPIEVPDKVEVAVDGRKVKVEGPLGKLDAIIPEGVKVSVGDEVTVDAPKLTRDNRGYQGLVRALIANMVEGVTKGYQKDLEISGVGYKADLRGRTLVLSLGYTHTIPVELPSGIEAEVDKSQTKLTIKGIDKQLVGQIAAQIRGYKLSEPYKGKGVKYANETVRRKAGKAAK